MNRQTLGALLLVASLGVSGAEPAESGAKSLADLEGALPGRLCAALEQIGPGEMLRIEASGYFYRLAHVALLMDPHMPECELDVQPRAVVKLDRERIDGAQLRAIDNIRGVRRPIWIVFEGFLYGPPAFKPDNPAFSVGLAQAVRGSTHYYGGYRAQLVIDEIRVIDVDPPQLPMNPDGSPYLSAFRRQGEPQVLAGRLPSYPEVAWANRLEGVVELELKVEAGAVKQVVLVEGDRLLAAASIEDAKSWRFDETLSFTTRSTFVYRLEQRRTGDPDAPKIVLELPRRVEITARLKGW